MFGQGFLALVGGFSSMFYLAFPDWSTLFVVLLTAILVIVIGHEFNVAKPALIAGFAGGVVATVLIILYVYVGFILAGPP